MSLQQLVIGWFYYGILYMGLSVLATVMINKVVKRWYITPLIVNAIAIIILIIGANKGFIPEAEQAFALYFIYMPIVVSSFTFNGCRELFKRLNVKQRIESYFDK